VTFLGASSGAATDNQIDGNGGCGLLVATNASASYSGNTIGDHPGGSPVCDER
jgi:hypothetical protein